MTTVREILIPRWIVECDEEACGYSEECSTQEEADGKKTEHDESHERRKAKGWK